MICKCGGDYVGQGFPAISGDRDSFGIGKAFIDERTGKEIDTWKKWERAGFKQPDRKQFKNDHVRESFENKTKMLKGQHLKQPEPEDMPL